MKRVFLFVAGLFALLAVAVAAAAWRLSAGPVSAPALRSAVETALSGAGEVFIDDVLVGWGAEGFGPDVRLRGVAILRDGALVGEAPELVVGFTLADMLSGGFEPAGIRIVGAALRLAIGADGAVEAAIGAGDGAPIAVHGAPSPDGGLSGLGRIALDDARIVLDASALGFAAPFALHGVDARFAEGDGAWTADAAFTLALDAMPIAVAAEGAWAADGVARVHVALPAAPPAALAALDPRLAPLRRYEGVAALEASARIDAAAFRLMRAAAEIRLPPGRWRPAPDGPAIDVLSGAIDLETGDVDLGAIQTDPAAALAGATLDAALELRGVGDGRPLPVSIAAGRTSGADETRISLRSETASIAAAVDAALAQARAFGIALARSPPVRLNAPGVIAIAGVIGDDRTLRAGSVRIESEAGRLAAPSIYPDAPIGVEDAVIAAAYSPADGGLRLDPSLLRLSAVAPGGRTPLLQASGAVTPTAQGGRRIDLSMSGDALDIAHYQALWPDLPWNTSRAWMRERIAAGAISNVQGDFVFVLDSDGGFALERSEAVFDIEGLSIVAKPGLAPIEGLAGRGVLDGFALDIAVTAGMQNGVAITGGVVAFPDLRVDPIDIVIDGTLDGSVEAMLAILDSPALGYSSQVGLSPGAASGRATGRLRLAFPLIRDLIFDDVVLDAQAELAGFGLRDAVGDADLSDATATLDVDGRRLILAGRGLFVDAATDFTWRETFDDGPDARETRASGVLDAAALAAIGVDLPADRLTGAIGADIVLTGGRGAPNRIRADLDLRETAMAIAEIGWAKPAGAPATARVEIVLSGDVVLNAPTVTFSGPGMSFAGSYAPGGAPDSGRVTASHLRFGRTAFDQLDVRFDRDAVVILGRGSGLDLGPARRADRGDEQAAGADDARADPLGVSALAPVAIDARIAVDQLWLEAETPPFADVEIRLSHDRTTWRAARVDGRIGDGAVAFDYAAGRDDADLAVRIEDVGAVVAGLGGPPRVRGGRLAATADPSAQGGVAGRVDLRDLRLVDAPIVARALQIASLTGVLESLAGPGLLFTSLGADWGLDDGVLSLANGKGANASLGLTFEGDIDLADDQLALRGTLAPAYLLSRVVGAIPLIGDILSPRDEGLFAFSYQAAGPLDDPKVSVNPLTALAPGVLRDLFPDSARKDAGR